MCMKCESLAAGVKLPKRFHTVEYHIGTDHRREGGFVSIAMAQQYADRQRAKGARIIGITSHEEQR